MTTLADLPRYQCHKVVQAGLIVSIYGGVLRVGAAPIGRDTLPGLDELAKLQEAVEVRVPDDEWQIEKKPAPGKILVVYDDGYMSVSPLEPFLMGYDLIKGGADEQPAPAA